MTYGVAFWASRILANAYSYSRRDSYERFPESLFWRFETLFNKVAFFDTVFIIYLWVFCNCEIQIKIFSKRNRQIYLCTTIKRGRRIKSIKQQASSSLTQAGPRHSCITIFYKVLEEIRDLERSCEVSDCPQGAFTQETILLFPEEKFKSGWIDQKARRPWKFPLPIKYKVNLDQVDLD